MNTPNAFTPQQAEQAERWLVRQQGGLNAQQQRELTQWLKNAGNAAAWRQAGQLWQQLGELPVPEVSRLRQQVQAELAASRRPRLRWLLPSLAMLLLAVLAWPAWQQLAPPEFEQSWTTLRGEQREVLLPDGSRLDLDAGTRLRVAYYPHRREVWLEQGQLLLQVAHQPQRPLTVHSGPSRVTVLGTEFSVRYLPQSMSGDGVQVAVRSGAVRVGPQSGWQNDWWRLVKRLGFDSHDSHLRVLRAGQQSHSDAAGLLVSDTPIAPQAVAEWQQARVSFDNTPLALALAEFARYGSVRYRLDPRLTDVRITGSFDLQRPDSFARALPAVLPVALKPQGESVLIAPRGAVAKKS